MSTSTETQSPSTQSQPPSFQPVNSIELVSTEASKITSVSVYSGRAEITRVFQFEVKTGQNQVIINGLPNVLDQDSLRIEGRGAATIHDVTVSTINRPQPETSSTLIALQTKRDKTNKALERCKKAISSIESYLGTMDVKAINVGQVKQVVKEYDSTAEELDNRVLELERELKDIEAQINKEQKNKTSAFNLKMDNKLMKRVVVGVFAEVEGEVEIVLIYAVRGASWTAGYDIRVDTHTDEEPVTLIYKASITQSTGEDWTNIPLTLETATPTFGISVPKLDSWTLSIYKPAAVPPVPLSSRAMIFKAPVESRETTLARRMSTRMHTQTMAASETESEVQEMSHRGLDVKGRGTVSATFAVPGLITIPTDGEAHNVTIARLTLGAVMSWVCVPKKDTKMHLSAKIKNASEYTLLRGTGSVYVDGSFISRSEVPAVSPEESFDCPLGLDPSIRITYPPLSKSRSESGFYTKSTTHVYTQTITLHNTKSTAVERVRVLEQVPVSQDAQVVVKVLNPALPSKGEGKERDVGKEKKVVVTKGVSAMWDGAEEGESGEVGEVGGRNGKLSWVVALPAQGKTNLVLQYEVVAPAGVNVVGLA